LAAWHEEKAKVNPLLSQCCHFLLRQQQKYLVVSILLTAAEELMDELD
jgi:hypothetical protein